MTDIAAADNRKRSYRREKRGGSSAHKIQYSVERDDCHGHHSEGNGPGAEHCSSV